MIAFLGTGLLGDGFVRALRRRGEDVTVFNRTRSRAEALAEVGAVVAASAEAAVHGASRIHLALSDDAAVDAVLEAARPGIAAGAAVLDHTTTSSKGARKRAALWGERGVEYLHAPVFMAPKHALESSGTMLVSGARAVVDKHRDALAAMTGKLVDLGEDPGRAAAHKLMGNSLIVSLTAGLVDVLALAKAEALPEDDAAELLAYFQPGAFLPQRLERIRARAFDAPSWKLAMARKDVRLMQEAAARRDVALVALDAVASAMDEAMARGDGDRDWTSFGRGVLG